MAEKNRPRLDKKGEGQASVSRLAGLGSGNTQLQGFDWSAAEPGIVLAVVISATRLGGLASLGRTRDGGAGTVTIFLDDDKTTVYIKPDQDIYGELEKIVHFLGSL